MATRVARTSRPEADTFLKSLTALSLADIAQDSQECPLCNEPYQDSRHSGHAVRLPCNHVLGKDCLAKWFKSSTTNANNNTCPFCRAELFERDEVEIYRGGERQDDLEVPVPEALRPTARARQMFPPIDGPRWRNREHQRVAERVEQFDGQVDRWDQRPREALPRIQALNTILPPRTILPPMETGTALDDAERLRRYGPRHLPELARPQPENARTREPYGRAMAPPPPRRRARGHEIPSLFRNEDELDTEPQINPANTPLWDPLPSTRARVEDLTNVMRSDEHNDMQPRPLSQHSAAPTSFAARMSARNEEALGAYETPMSRDNWRTAAPRQRPAEEIACIDEVINWNIRPEPNAAMGDMTARADTRERPRLGEQAYNIPIGYERTPPNQRPNEMTGRTEIDAREGALAFGQEGQVSGSGEYDVPPRGLNRENATLGAGIGRLPEEHEVVFQGRSRDITAFNDVMARAQQPSRAHADLATERGRSGGGAPGAGRGSCE